MPHVEIKLYPGKTEEEKALCAEKITQVLAETLGARISGISVAIREVAQEDWKTQVWDKDIAPAKDLLYKQPGYTME